MEWNEKTLFAAWKGRHRPAIESTSWSKLIRNGEHSALVEKVDQRKAADFDHLHEVCKEVDRVLWQHWDPLTINKLAACRNEYHEFAWDIACAASIGSEAEMVAELYALERFYFNVEREDAIQRSVIVTEKLFEAIGLCEVE